MHRVKFVDDEAMPEGHDFVFAVVGERHVVFFRRSAVSPELIEEAWAAYRACLLPIPTSPAPTPPQPRSEVPAMFSSRWFRGTSRIGLPVTLRSVS